MDLAMAVSTDRDQILTRIVSELAAEADVVDLEIL
jgi:hypothetical protein